MIWGLVRMVIALLVILPGTFFVTRWYGQRQRGGQDLRVKEVLSLGSNRALYVVEWEDRRYLLGVTNQTITLLDLDPQADMEEEGPE